MYNRIRFDTERECRAYARKHCAQGHYRITEIITGPYCGTWVLQEF